MLALRRRTEYNAGIKEEESKGRWSRGGEEERRTLAPEDEESRGGR